MKKYMRYVLPALALAVLLTTSAGEASGQDILRQILKRMDDNNKSLVSLKGSIKMAKTDAALGETDLYEGELNYLPGQSQSQIYVRIDWIKPAVEHLAVAKGQYVLYSPKQNRAIVGKVDSAGKNTKAGGALAFMTMSKAELSANYDVEYKGEETVSGGVNTWHLVLKPKKAATYKSADLWVDSNGMPVQAKVVEKNNDSTTVNISGVQKNATIKANIFQITPAKGTEIVKG